MKILHKFKSKEIELIFSEEEGRFYFKIQDANDDYGRSFTTQITDDFCEHLLRGSMIVGSFLERAQVQNLTNKHLKHYPAKIVGMQVTEIKNP
jgi:hypothetical protein